MTLFFLLNPKLADVGALVTSGFGGGALKRSESTEGEEIKKKVVERPELSQYSDLLRTKLEEFESTAIAIKELGDRIKILLKQQELAIILDAQEKELLQKRVELAKLILQMQEEEQTLLLLLMN